MTRLFKSALGGAYLRPVVVGLIYFLAASATIMSSRFGGGVAILWVATAVLLAELSLTPARNWKPTLLCCGIASFAATSLFGFGISVAIPLALVNLSEAVIGALVLRRFHHRPGPLASLHDVASFVFAAGVVAPAMTAFGGATASAALGFGFWNNWLSWFTGHALGTVTFAPIVASLIRTKPAEWKANLQRQTMTENLTLLTLIVATDLAVFSQSSQPLLFLPILVVMVSTIWRGQLGAGVSIVMLAMIGGVFTVMEIGTIASSEGSVADAVLFFQFYLAMTVLTILPVAADLTRRRLLHEDLLASEARYRLVTENSSDLIVNLDRRGNIRYASQSIQEMGNYKASELVGRHALELVVPEDRAANLQTHLKALAHPDRTFTVEYRGIRNDGEIRWFETRCRGVIDDSGQVSGVVSSVRDISDRKLLESKLTHDASTDFLTGLPNRRAFMDQLQALSIKGSDGDTGCIAIVDLDHFKTVNDLHGHLAGDEVLKRFAECASAVLRVGDIVARIGGEEFGLIFYGASVHQAMVICERLRRRVENTVFSDAGGNGMIKVTISAGVAELEWDKPIGDVLCNADSALYQAKATGRNRLAVAA